MTWSMMAAFVWLIAANLLGMLPSKDNHWRRAYVLIGVGIPVLGWVFWENPVWIGVIVLIAGLSVLRWPVIYLGRWVRRVSGQ
ncbi:DUF2484 family protein [Aestuariibius sp. HNIBRBA575]|uniref:DUF2484 family protein n=1 Tax=Aestuariibius sp. HNIBRBA575 TaxID=3233343 RepID=UPI0034A5A683